MFSVVVTILLLSDVSKYCVAELGTTNFNKAPNSICFNSVVVNAPVLKGIISDRSVKYPVD